MRDKYSEEDLRNAARILAARGGRAKSQKKGFGSMTPEQRREAGSKGGIARKKKYGAKD